MMSKRTQYFLEGMNTLFRTMCSSEEREYPTSWEFCDGVDEALDLAFEEQWGWERARDAKCAPDCEQCAGFNATKDAIRDFLTRPDLP